MEDFLIPYGGESGEIHLIDTTARCSLRHKIRFPPPNNVMVGSLLASSHQRRRRRLDPTQ